VQYWRIPAITHILNEFMWANFHTHTNYCDGKTSVAELYDEAVRNGMLSIGISSHAPLPFERAWAMKASELDSYIGDINAVRAAGKCQLYAGLEIDYVPGKMSPLDFHEHLDYTIGSIHFVDSFDNGDGWEIDNTFAVFKDGLDRIFKGNVREAITRYFQLTREMIVTSPPDVIGHLDKIKIQNVGEGLYREEDQWYRDEISQTIRVIKNTGCIVEVNTRGIYQKKSSTTYPSPWIIRLLKENNIPVTISSDAHHPKDLTNCFQDAAKIIAQAGYETIQILHEGNWRPIRFNEHGLIL
jgi:histidinol-phosphatase (PHP family)